MKVFLSHSFQKEDRDKFDDLWAALEARGIPVWDPETMPAGLSLRDKLRAAIRDCSVCVFIATEGSLKSNWCAAELGAFWGLGKPVVVYLADPNVKPEALPEQFKGDLYTAQKPAVLRSVKAHLEALDPFSSEPIVKNLKEPVDRMQYFIRIHERSRSLFSVSMGYDISDNTYYTAEQTERFLASVRRIIYDQDRRYERYQIVTGAPQSWLRFLLETASNAPHCYIRYLNVPDPTLFRARMMQLFVSDDINEQIGKVTYLVTSVETGASRPYGLQVCHRGFAEAFEGQVASYYSEAHKRFGIEAGQLARQLDLDESERRQIIADCVKAEFPTLVHQDEDNAVLTVIRRTNALDHGCIRELIREERVKQQALAK
ncbi:MAG: toll/interleukin-1 receptor domain-containing protein [Candidatus Accumulibacter similis]|nr:MAG: toll/interleukin-1 receptor domain-containing protein [Candidatus Accumulibacter similis]